LQEANTFLGGVPNSLPNNFCLANNLNSLQEANTFQGGLPNSLPNNFCLANNLNSLQEANIFQGVCQTVCQTIFVWQSLKVFV
jgi:hypothetical protein